MFSNQPTRNTVVTWRRFSGKGYSAFRSLGREIRIGVLAVSTLMAAHNDSLATRTDSLRIVKDAVSSSDLSLFEATVTGSQLPVSLDKAWSKIVVISRQEIDNAKCQTINDILELCPNVDVRQRGAMGVQTDISLPLAESRSAFTATRSGVTRPGNFTGLPLYSFESISVSIQPGQTAVQVIPFDLSSTFSARA